MGFTLKPAGPGTPVLPPGVEVLPLLQVVRNLLDGVPGRLHRDSDDQDPHHLRGEDPHIVPGAWVGFLDALQHLERGIPDPRDTCQHPQGGAPRGG